MNDVPAFEFTRHGILFKIYEDGRVTHEISPLDREAMMVINRIPALIAKAERDARASR